MKLKALKPRLHNAIFHTHTVSGIVISFALFICFYGGAVALFMDEIYQWENPEARIEPVHPDQIDYDKVIHTITEKIPDFDSSQQFGIIPPNAKNPLIQFNGIEKTSDGKTKRLVTYINPHTYTIQYYGKTHKTNMIRTIYELHYFKQIPVVGKYISGFVAFFFLFAIITGLLIHWKNIINKFYLFTTKGKWKQIWTNTHTSLGFIALPFQLIYAVTSALLGLSALLLAPSAFLIFNGDTSEIIKSIQPSAAIKYDKNAKIVSGTTNLNSLYRQVSSKYPDNAVTLMYSDNYGKEDGTITIRVDNHKITGDGIFVFGYKDGKLMHAIVPNNESYAKSAYGALIKLHYVTYGGIFLKIMHFILAMITCYIIMSGIMIWRTARDNKKYTEKQRKFHHRVTKFYLAVTLSLFPAIALIFVANKLVPLHLPNRVFYVNSSFFLGWLVLTILGLFWNNYARINRNYIYIGSILGITVPIINGFITDDWIWKTLISKQYYVFSVDFTWFFIGIGGLLISRYYLKPKEIKNTQQDKEHLLEEKAIILENPTPVLSSNSLNTNKKI